MSWELTSYTVLALFAVVVSSSLSVVALRNRSEPYTKTFLALMVALAGWAGLYGVQLGFTDVSSQLVWLRAAVAVGAVVPTLWLVFAVQYVGAGDRLFDGPWWLLGIEPILAAVLTLTNGSHQLVWGDPEAYRLTGLALPGGIVPNTVVADVTLGPGYAIHSAYSYALIAVGVLLVGRVVFSESSLLTTQASLLVAGAIPPSVANLTYLMGVSPIPNLDTTPFAFVVTGVVWGVALYQLDFLDRGPTAQRRAVQEAGGGLIVVDEDGTVVKTNEIGREVFDPSPTVGEPVDDLLPYPDADPTALDGVLVTAVRDNRRHVYDVRVTGLDDPRGRVRGYAIVAWDVTERDSYQQRLEVVNRVLRHNLSNDMNVIVGRARLIREAADDESLKEAARTIGETSLELLETSEKARAMLKIPEHRDDPVTIDVSRPARRVARSLREEYPNARISVDAPESAPAVVGRENDFETAIENLVENAIEHHDGEEPTVGIDIEEWTDQVQIHVRDDGPGIPEMERRSLMEGSETPLDHGSGLGLWLARWTANAVGGDIAIADRDPRGTRVTLSFPADDGN